MENLGLVLVQGMNELRKAVCSRKRDNRNQRVRALPVLTMFLLEPYLTLCLQEIIVSFSFFGIDYCLSPFGPL